MFKREGFDVDKNYLVGAITINYRRNTDEYAYVAYFVIHNFYRRKWNWPGYTTDFRNCVGAIRRTVIKTGREI